LERELTPWEQEYLEEMYEQKEKFERQLKIVEEVIEGEPLFTFDLPGYVEDKAVECKVDQFEREEPLFADEFTDEENRERKSYKQETDVEYTMVSSGDWSKACTQEWHAQHIEVKEAILVEVEEDHGWDVRMVEERMPDVWMVEDESLRTRKVSKRRGMIRKWIPDPCDKKGRGPRGLKEAEKRAKTTHAWPKRQVRARMRDTHAHEKRRVQSSRQGRAHVHWRRCTWHLEARQSGAQGVDVGWLMRARGCGEWTASACRRTSECEGWPGKRTTLGVCSMHGGGRDARTMGSDAGDGLDRVGIGVPDDDSGAQGNTREEQCKNKGASLILVGIGKARILILAGIGKAVECRNARGRSVAEVILGRSENVTGIIFLVGIGIVDMGSKHGPTRNRSGAAGARDL
ncbi:Unknown protein, partial [Striga hermonthica]